MYMRLRTLELSKLASRTIRRSPRNSSKFVPSCCFPHGISLIINVVQFAASRNFSMMCRKLLASAVLSNAVIRAERDFFFQAEDGIRDLTVTGVQTCALPI